MLGSSMIVLIANNTGCEANSLLEAFPERIGHIYSPAGWRGPWRTYALDNGAFPLWRKGGDFDEVAFRSLCRRATDSGVAPRWVAVPDVVADAPATVASWGRWEGEMLRLGMPLAMCVQDGMRPEHVPATADVVFVGGSTTWKWDTVQMWCRAFPRVHVGRVNTEALLWRAHNAGAESCDGSGWFRGDRKQLDGLWHYLADSEGVRDTGAHQFRFAFDARDPH
jgi:hypothetical protein